MPASQAFLDATKNGSYSTPSAWETLATQWEATGISAAETTLWVNAGISSSNIAVQAIAAGLTPVDADLIGPWLKVQSPLPTLARALGAAAVMRAVVANGFNPSDVKTRDILNEIYVQMGILNINVVAI